MKRPFDPTNTYSQRASFRREALRRMQTLLRIARVAVIGQDMFGLAPAKPLHGIPAHLFRSEPMENSRKLQVFMDWFRGAAQTILIGDQRWFVVHMQQAYDSGLKAAETYTKRAPTSIMDDLFREKALHELQGIIDATMQQASRVVSSGVLQGKRPRHIYLGISVVVKRVMGIRLNMLANTMTVELHNTARLDEFRVAGITKVGVIPERLPPKVVHDALVEILTAGDDDVCEECQDYADDGPYDLDDLELPLHPNCLPGDCFVSSSSRVTAISKRLYYGNMVVIRTSSGREFSCTPNHPVLSDQGFVPACSLKVGGNVISDSAVKWSLGADAHDKNMPTRIEDIATAFFKRISVTCVEVPVTGPDFHGDVLECDVAVIGTDCLLRGNKQTTPVQHANKLSFGVRVIRYNLLASLRTLFFGFSAVSTATACVMSSGQLSLALTRSHTGPFNTLLFGLGSWFNAMRGENSINNTPAETVTFRERKNAAAGLVISEDCFLDCIVDIGSRYHSGLVYNMQTEASYYIAQGIASHNCRCAYVPADDARFAPSENESEEWIYT